MTQDSLCLILLILIAVGIPLVLIGGLIAVARKQPAPTELARERRLVMLVRFAGVAVGLAFAIVLVTAPGFLGLDLAMGRGPMLAPVGFGLATLLGIIGGELLARPAPSSGPRQASLATRRVRDYLPTGYATALAFCIVAAGATLALTTATADTDELSGAARLLSHACSPSEGASRSPYPGGYYSLPLLIGLALSLGAAAYAARRVVLRPRGAAPDTGDDVLRRRSLSAVAGGLGIAITAPLAGVSFIAGTALLGISCQAGWFVPVGWLLIANALVAVVVFSWSVAILLTAGTAVRQVVPVGAGR